MTAGPAAAPETAATVARLLEHRAQIIQAAQAIEPLLNRVVFTGRHAAELLCTHVASGATRARFASDAVLRVLSSSALDRLAVDLERLGLRRGVRTANSERWILDERLLLDVTYVSGDESERDAIWLAYASLLTMPLIVGDGLTARITGAPALLALGWAALKSSGEDLLDSGDLEDLIALVAGRAEIVREVHAAPPELREFVATETRRFLSYDGAHHIVQHAVPGAKLLPALADRVIDRLGQLSTPT